MKTLLSLCVIAALGYAGWSYSHRSKPQWNTPQAGQQHAKQPQVAATTPTPTPAAAAPSPAPVASATPLPHVAPAGTFTKEELITAINKDAKESSLEELLGAPSFTKPTGWSSLYCWKGKLDIGGDSPVGIAVEVVKYKETPLIVGIYDAASKSITPLPWRNKVAEAYNDAMQWYYNDQEKKASIAAQNRQLQVYKQAAADSQRWARSQQSQYVSPLSASAVRVGSGNDDQPVRESGTVFGTVGGSGTTKAAAYASAMSQLQAGWAPGKVPATGVPRFRETNGGWECHMDLAGSQ